MTTHDQRVDAESATPVDPETAADGETSDQAEQAQPEAVPPSPDVNRVDDGVLVGAEPADLRSRWDDIQATFVDDPAECVQMADGLVAEVVEQLMSGLANVRSRLEAQWADGETASTEDLRVALMRYRELFERLLAV